MIVFLPWLAFSWFRTPMLSAEGAALIFYFPFSSLAWRGV